MYQGKNLKFNQGYDEDGDTPLHFAAATGKTNLVFNCIYGKDINVKNKMGWTPLMLAARNGHMDCVKLLLEFGADVLRRNRFGVCSLSHAVASGNLDIVRILLNKILQKRVRLTEIERPVSPIIFAILFNHVEILQYLIRKGLHAKTETGDIPTVMFRAVTSNKETMEILEQLNISAMNRMTNDNLTLPNISITDNNFSPISSPMLHPNISSTQNRSRKFSNFNVSVIPKTPDISPILLTNSPNFFSNTFTLSLAENSPTNDYLNKRFSLPSKNNGFMKKFEDNNKSNIKGRSHSHNVHSVQELEYNEVEEDVFENSPVETNASSCKNREFIELLRKKSLDCCVELFQKHEIDMDVFVTLSKGDLDEIGINWNKRADVLELIYLLNK